MIKWILASCCLALLPAPCTADEPRCPTKPGLYALLDAVWQEVPREAVPVNNYKPGFMLPNISKELAGEKAFISIRNPAKFCVSGSTSAATYSLERAKVKHGTREFVQSGSFRNSGENQSQGLASITDEDGFTHLLVRELKVGQYVIWMHGTFKEPTKKIEGDPSTAAMTAAIAAAQSISSGTQGFLFAFGVD
ncbi:MAG: hypothetical protein ACRYGF_04640 [Janthinobacterium lividum]